MKQPPRRQMEVWKLRAEGQNTKEIAFELGIACRTVDNTQAALCRRIGARNASDLTRLAIAYGVIPMPVDRHFDRRKKREKRWRKP